MKNIGCRISKQKSIRMYQAILDHPIFDKLTERQQDVITYLAYGMTFREIGKEAGVSLQAIMQVRDGVFRRLGFVNNQLSTGGLTFRQIYQEIIKFER